MEQAPQDSLAPGGPTLDARDRRVPPSMMPDPALSATPIAPAIDVSDVTRAGDYVLDSVLAEGGFGVVYRARHAGSGTAAAVKVLHAELASRADVVTRFEREVEAIRRVQHPNVVEVLERGRLSDSRPYFVMELLDGVSLEQHLESHGALPPDEALAILEPLCDALEAAHARSIVHRDVKPSNVFLSEQGGRRRVMLLDFGIAKLMDADGPALTSARRVVGTPACISPEQIRGEQVDPRTDVYALGALLYAMLTGTPPFAQNAFPVLRSLHLYATPPRPSARAGVSAAFDAVVQRAMSKDPASRQSSAAAFLAEVRAAVAEAIGDAAAPRERRALGLHLEVLADAAALDAPDEELLSDLESVLPRARRELAVAGFAPVLETGTSALFAAAWPDRPDLEAGARRAAVAAARLLYRRLGIRAGRDPRVHVRVCLDAGVILTASDGSLAGGSLLELPAWSPSGAGEGVFVTTAALGGLDIAAEPCEGAVGVLRIAP